MYLSRFSFVTRGRAPILENASFSVPNPQSAPFSVQRTPHFPSFTPPPHRERFVFWQREGRVIVACEVGAWYGETEPCTMDDRLVLGLLIK